MQRRIMLFNMFCFIFFAILMFYVKFHFQKISKEFVFVNKEFVIQQKNYKILRAEYAYLGSSERLAMMACKYLKYNQQTAYNFDYNLYKKIYGQDSSVFKLANNVFSRHN